MVVTVARQRPNRILLVDDDMDIVEALRAGLDGRGYSVEAFTNPSAALAAFGPGRYDVAVLDVRMSPFDGMELYRRLKSLDPRLRVCFLTAYADLIIDRPPGSRFLQKPTSLTDLVKALEGT